MAGQIVGAVADKIREYPFRAAAALSKLDSGNRMVARCRVYLERLISTSGLYSKSILHVYQDWESSSDQELQVLKSLAPGYRAIHLWAFRSRPRLTWIFPRWVWSLGSLCLMGTCLRRLTRLPRRLLALAQLY